MVGSVLPGVPRTNQASCKTARAVSPSKKHGGRMQSGVIGWALRSVTWWWDGILPGIIRSCLALDKPKTSSKVVDRDIGPRVGGYSLGLLDRLKDV